MALPDVLVALNIIAAVAVIGNNLYQLGLRAGWWKRRRQK